MAQALNEARVQGEIFLDPTEKLLCAAGSPQLGVYLEKGKIRKCFAVLSDRAVYCKGMCCVSRDRRRYQTRKTDFRLDLEEFQGLKYLQRKNQLLLTLAFFFLLLGPALLLLDKLSDFGARVVLNPTLDAVLSILLAGVFFLLYSIHQKTLLELIHTNGSIGLELKALPQKEERLLIRYLRAYLNSLEKQEPAPEEEAPEADDEEYDEDEEEEGEEPT